jgi:hypothetical protein
MSGATSRNRSGSSGADRCCANLCAKRRQMLSMFQPETVAAGSLAPPRLISMAHHGDAEVAGGVVGAAPIAARSAGTLATAWRPRLALTRPSKAPALTSCTRGDTDGRYPPGRQSRDGARSGPGEQGGDRSDRAVAESSFDDDRHHVGQSQRSDASGTAAAVAPTKLGLLNRARSSMGRFVRCSTTTKPMSNANPATISATVRGVVQFSRPWTRPARTPARPRPSSSVPATSTGRGSAPRDSSRNARPQTARTAATTVVPT